MKKELHIGQLMSGAPFTIPLDFVTRTLAIIGIRGWGKTIGATVIAEEMCEAGLPWVAIDPVGVWWGLRCNPDGSPGGYPVVVIGGEHGDLPLEKDNGARVADAILQENVSCVIDMSNESKTSVRHFVADFCDRLMELRPQHARHIFLEEAPELVPQKPMGEQKRSLAAVDRLVRLGRNKGYGATLISQRYATIQKDVLTQCESLIAGRMIGKTDRVASEEWIGEVAASLFSNRKADKFIDSLAAMESGHGWFLSPQWESKFVEIQIRRRKTYHPGATRTVGQAPKQVQLCDVKEFVDRFKSVLAVEKHADKVYEKSKAILNKIFPSYEPEVTHDVVLDEEVSRLRTENADLTRRLSATRTALETIRKRLEPEYRSLQALFGDLDANSAPTSDAAVYDPWKQKLGPSCAKMIDVLIQRGEQTRIQVATLTGQSPRSSTFVENISKLNRNGLIEKNGDMVKLRSL